VLDLFADSRQFITSVLIGNNLVNISATVFLTLFLESRFGIHNEWVVTAILAPVLIILGEATPKSYGRFRGRGFLLDHANLTLFFARLFGWPARLLLGASDLFIQRRGGKIGKNILVNEDEFRFLIEESVRSGVLEEHEKKLVERILDFERIPVERVIHPVVLVSRVELSAKVREAKEEARRSGSKIVLVYEEIPSIVIGMIYIFDLLFEENEEKGLREYLRSPIFLPKETPLEKAFLALQAKRQSFAVVTDARREVIGVVDIENLIAI
jgi:CBS domain containing-hemolysin-like protein